MIEQTPAALSPLRTRLIAFAVLAAIALASIALIDHRAMQLMREYERERGQPAPPTTLVERTFV